MKSEVFTFIDIVGTAAFSVSGVYAAMEKKLDIFGIFIIAFITAIGGGTIRDVLIGDFPVNWMRTNNYSIVIFVSAAVALLFHKLIFNYDKVLMFFDSLGLGFFTVVGIHKGIEFGFDPGLCVALGTITACFGGLIRDISLSQIPQIFHKEVYATACIFGGILYFLLLKTTLSADALDMICISVIVIIRVVAVKYNLSLPVFYRSSK
jgi:uncharacterized membrane protein YeiH